MNLHKYFPDSVRFVKDVNKDMAQDQTTHKGVKKHIRLTLRSTNYLWTPLFIGLDILFRWILQIKPQK